MTVFLSLKMLFCLIDSTVCLRKSCNYLYRFSEKVGQVNFAAQIRTKFKPQISPFPSNSRYIIGKVPLPHFLIRRIMFKCYQTTNY